ncbi:MAG: cell division protein SepF [Snowella sp.]|jgi:cell division inhibitor SepF|nr:MAG: cell division protein SepF [Snowella sp.]
MILTKIKDFVGISERDEYEEDYEEMDWQQPQEQVAPIPEENSSLRRPNRDNLTLNNESTIATSARNNVIGMPGINNTVAEVVVVEPHSFEEMPQVIQTLRERKSVVLNLNVMDPEEAQRAVDFVAGGTYAIDGHQERIGESIFLFTPNSVKVSTLSGTVHDSNETATPGTRTPLSAPAWGLDSSRLAQ